MADRLDVNPSSTVVVNGKTYTRIGDKLVDQKTIWSEEVQHPDGRVDCTVHIPYLQIASKQELT